MEEKKKRQSDPYMGAYLAVSIGAGVALGTALDNLAIGIAIGVGLWPLFALIGRKFSIGRKNSPEEMTDETKSNNDQ